MIACIIASGTAEYRVHSRIFFRPDSPSFCIYSSEGTTVPNSWKIIEAEMYGITPSPNTVLCPSDPPENSVT